MPETSTEYVSVKVVSSDGDMPFFSHLLSLCMLHSEWQFLHLLYRKVTKFLHTNLESPQDAFAHSVPIAKTPLLLLHGALFSR
jgi:hypothetical protein